MTLEHVGPAAASREQSLWRQRLVALARSVEGVTEARGDSSRTTVIVTAAGAVFVKGRRAPSYASLSRLWRGPEGESAGGAETG